MSKKKSNRICFLGDYGGLGKCGFSINFALSSSTETSKNILLIDLYDDQRNTKQLLNLTSINDNRKYILPVVEETQSSSKMTDIFYGDEAIPYKTKISKNIDLIASDGSSKEIFEYLKIIKKNVELEFMSFSMENYFDQKNIKEQYDFLIFDVPIDINETGLATLSIADCIILPVKIDEHSEFKLSKSMEIMNRAINIGNKKSYKLKILPIFDDVSEPIAEKIIENLKLNLNDNISIINIKLKSEMLYSTEHFILNPNDTKAFYPNSESKILMELIQTAII
jgi:cellulose biosynthesis protein BcsQ